MIEKISFGSMRIQGRIYTTDLIIFPDGRIQDQWWRGQGHRLTLADIAGLVELQPVLIIVGTGIYGRMKPEKGLRETLAERRIDLVTAWTKAAGDQFNTALQRQNNVAACFHLTC